MALNLHLAVLLVFSTEYTLQTDVVHRRAYGNTPSGLLWYFGFRSQNLRRRSCSYLGRSASRWHHLITRNYLRYISQIRPPFHSFTLPLVSLEQESSSTPDIPLFHRYYALDRPFGHLSHPRLVRRCHTPTKTPTQT